MLGLCVAECEWELLMFVSLAFHCWLRPNEVLTLLWCDLCLEDLVQACGVLKVQTPEIKVPVAQHVILESPEFVCVWKLLHSVLCKSLRNAFAVLMHFNCIENGLVLCRYLMSPNQSLT